MRKAPHSISGWLKVSRITTGLLALLAGLPQSGQSAQSASPPQRIVSTNVCADQLLMLLAAPEQIATITHLSREQGASYFYEQAAQYPLNRGQAEDILPFKPDLVIAGEYGSEHTLQLLGKLGIRVERLPIAYQFEDVYANIRRMAEWVGKPERGEQIITDMQARLAKLPPRQENAPIAAVYDPNGYTVGNATLRGQSMQMAGWRNAGELMGISSYGTASLEEMIHIAPAALIESPYTQGTWSRAEALSRHPALRSSGLHPYIIRIPSKLTICEGPWSVDVVEQLHNALSQVQPSGVTN